MVFWRETGTKDDDDDVEAREGACSMETAMVEGGVCRGEGDGQEAVTLFLCGRGRGRAMSINQRRLWGNCSGRARPARRGQRSAARVGRLL
jgi:hypothetical protein